MVLNELPRVTLFPSSQAAFEQRQSNTAANTYYVPTPSQQRSLLEAMTKVGNITEEASTFKTLLLSGKRDVAG